MSRNYTAQNVFEAALDRIRWVYRECDDVIVSMSGGKDSAVIFELAKLVAAELGRLPLKCFWLDQEAEWLATEDQCGASCMPRRSGRTGSRLPSG